MSQTRILHLNKTAPTPPGLPSTDRFLLREAGGIRIGGGPHAMSGEIVTSFMDELSAATYAAFATAWATLDTVNGVPIIDFSDTESASPGSDATYVLPQALTAADAFTQVAIWEPGSFDTTRHALFHSTASTGASLTAAMRQHTNGTVEGRAQRTSASALTIIDMAPAGIGGWLAFALSIDYGNDLARMYNLLTGETSPAVPIAGSGAQTAPSIYRLAGGPNVRFTGRAAHFQHFPYVLTDADVTALQAHAKALVGAITL